MKLESVAQKQSLKQSPREVLPDNHAKPKFELTGTRSPLQMSPSSVKYGAGTKSGEFEMSGALKIKLNDTPRKGYESASTPMSHRADEASRIY